MNTHYQWRWIYLAIINSLLLAMSCVYDFQPMLAQINELNQREVILIKKLSIEKSLHKKHQRSKNKVLAKKTIWSKIQDINARAHITGLQIRSMNFLPSKNAAYVRLHLVAEADFAQWYAFILHLQKLDHYISIQDFSCKLNEKNKLVFISYMLLYDNHVYPSYVKYAESKGVHNLFCVLDSVFAETSDSVDLYSVPIQQIKMVGYLQDQRHHQALILLPNQMMLSVMTGMRIGKERAKIIEIHKDKMIATFPDAKRIELQLL